MKAWLELIIALAIIILFVYLMQKRKKTYLNKARYIIFEEAYDIKIALITFPVLMLFLGFYYTQVVGGDTGMPLTFITSLVVFAVYIYLSSEMVIYDKSNLTFIVYNLIGQKNEYSINSISRVIYSGRTIRENSVLPTYEYSNVKIYFNYKHIIKIPNRMRNSKELFSILKENNIKMEEL